MHKVKVGLIGLGEVAQLIHLPILEALSDRYEIGALCDISPQLLQQIGDRYNVSSRYTDAYELARQADLDAVFVLNSDEYHADCAVAALRHGKHVFIEKPVCLTLRDADAIIDARRESGKQAMVGYMRRYAPAFTEAVDDVRSLGKINYARIRDIIGGNRLFIDQSGTVLRPSDITEEAIRDKRERAERMVREALGDVSADLQSAYRLLCGLSSHDLSAMREIIGFPKRVAAAAQWNGGSFITAQFEYDGYYAVFETGIDNIRRFDAHIQVYGDRKSVLVQYNTPYIRHLPTTKLVQETAGESYIESVNRPTYKDAYTIELEHFHEVATGQVQPKTTVEDAKEDLRLFGMIIDAMR